MNGKQLRNSILQWAISGRLVPQCPTDEPAIELLKRINPKAAPLSPDDAPFTIPDSWCWCRLGNIVQINPKNDCPDDTTAAFIPMEKVEATYGSQYTYDEVKWGSIKKGYTHFANGDVAFAKITPCFQNRKSAVFNDLPNGIGAGTTELKVLRPCGETLNRWYLLYFLKSSYFIEEAKFKGTANQQRVVKGYIENKMFPLPPLAEQERIVRKVEELLPLVERYDKAQTELDHLNASLKGKLRASVLQEAIRGRLVPQDPNDEPASLLLKRINPKAAPLNPDDAPFDVPDSWCWCRLGSLCVFLSRGKSPKYSEERKYPVFAQKCNLKDGGISLEQARFLDPSTIDKWKEVYKLRNGDVLINSTGTGTVCRTRMFDEKCLGDYPFVVPDSHVSVVRTYEEINSTFVLYYISSRNTQQYLEDNLAGSTNQKELYIGVLENLLIPLPPLAEQERIVRKVEELFAVLDRLSPSAN